MQQDFTTAIAKANAENASVGIMLDPSWKGIFNEIMPSAIAAVAELKQAMEKFHRVRELM